MRRRKPTEKTPKQLVIRRVKRLKLVELMEERGVSAYAIAKAINVSTNTIKAYLDDEGRDPTHGMVVNLKIYFGLERDEDLVEYEDVVIETNK